MAYEAKETCLTPRQISVLRMRAKGISVAEIAKTLGTSCSNIYTLYRQALKNVEKARKTLKLYAEIQGGIEVLLPKNTRLEDVPGIVFREADAHGIHVTASSAGLLLKLEKKLPSLIDSSRRVLTATIRAYVKADGEVEFRQEA